MAIMKSVNTRRTVVGITYNGKDTKSLEQFLETFSYVDESNGAGDTIDIQLHNLDKRWLNEWFPKKSDNLIAQIKTYNWDVQYQNWYKENEMKIFKCGKFILDDFSFSGRPLLCSIKGISSPCNSSFKSTKRTKTWEKVTVKGIAEEVAKRAGISLHYDAESFQIKSIEQSSQTDSEFLSNLCKEYGLYMKIYVDKIVIYDPFEYDKKDTVLTIDEKDMISWSWNTTTEGTYTGGKMKYTDASNEKDYECSIGSGPRILDVSGKADSKQDAIRKVEAAVNLANRSTSTMSITMMGNFKLIASACVKITGLGKLNGKYFVDKVSHSVGNGYEVSLEISRVQNKITINGTVETEEVKKKTKKKKKTTRTTKKKKTNSKK